MSLPSPDPRAESRASDFRVRGGRASGQRGPTAERRGGSAGGGPGDAVLQVDSIGRVTYANLAAAQLVGRESAIAVLGEEVGRVLRIAGHGSAALALHAAIDAMREAGAQETSFVVHDPQGRPVTAWTVTARGAGVAVVVRPGTPADAEGGGALDTAPAASAPPPAIGRAPGTPSAPGTPGRPGAPGAPDADALVDLARELAGAADHVDQALERLAAGAATLLGADGACVVMLDPDGARIAAGSGTLAPLQGQRTELHAPPSPLHEAITERRVVVAGGAPGDDAAHGAARPGRRILVAPLVVGDTVHAALCVVSESSRGYSVRDRALAGQLAEHGSLALRNHRLYETVERSARDARLLADTAQILARHVTPQALYPALARVVREGLGASGFIATLADPATGDVERLYSEGTGAIVVAAPVGFWDTGCGRVARDGRPLFVDGTLPDAPTDGERTISERLRGSPVRAMALLPLHADATRGVLSMHFPERRAFDESERRLLADFAAHVAVAVRNAGLFAARERERDRAAAAAEIARVALDAETLDVGATAILGVLDGLVPSDGKALSVLRHDASSLDCAAATGTVAFMRGLQAPRAVRALPTPTDGRVTPVVVDDLRRLLTRERCPEAADHPAIVASAVIVPLVARGRALGDLAVTTPYGRPLDAAARDTLVQLAAPIALALDALLLAEERRRRVAEERQMAEQLRQAEKMAALGELVAGVAHEINNPLTGISAFAELLLDDPLTADQRDSVRLIKREADRAVAVVRDLLVFSRKAEPAYEALDLNALFERTLRLRAYAMRAVGIDVAMALDPMLPVVHGDAAKLQQVVLNVLLNAEHALRDAPVRRLDASTRRLGARRVVLSITDSGTGIAPDVLPRIFEPFFTTKPAGEGTGLGLSVSYGIVQAHGGELRAESTPGAGTTIEVVLPLHSSDAFSAR